MRGDFKPAATFLSRPLVMALGLLWVGVYLLFTLRAVSLGFPHHVAHALVRAALTGAGMGLCIVLQRLIEALAARPVETRILPIGLAVCAAGLLHALLNYATVYLLLNIWWQQQPTSVLIVQYFIGTVWIYALWVALVFLLPDRAGPTGDEAASGPGSDAECIWVRHNGGLVRIAFGDLRWIEAERDYVRFHLRDFSYLHRATMESIERLLGPHGFIRIHRRFLVRAAELNRVATGRKGRRHAVLAGGVELPVGRHYLPRLPAFTSLADAARVPRIAGGSC